MNRRPASVTVIGCLLIAAGIVGIVYHASEFKGHPFQYEMIWISLVRLTAVLCGVYMLRGSNWARWLALLWIAFHVVVSAFHSLAEFAMHALLFVVFAYFLLRPAAAQYFRGARTDAA
jgi:hypothetical protein